MKLAFALILILAASTAQAQCRGGSCSVPEPEYHGWYELTGGRIGFWFHGQYVGALDPITTDWQTAGKASPTNLVKAFGFKNSEKIEKPVKEKCHEDCECGTRKLGDAPPPLEEIPVWMKEGIKLDERAAKGKESYRLNGRDVPRNRIFEALGDTNMPDDSKSIRLVVVGSDAARSKVASDFAAMSEFQGKVVIQTYDPGHWHVAGLYPQKTDPTLYIVQPDGTLSSVSSYAQGSAGLKRALTAAAGKLRTPQPVNPDAVPDLTQPSKTPAPTPDQPAPVQPGAAAPLFDLTKVPAAVYVGAALALLIVSTRKKD